MNRQGDDAMSDERISEERLRQWEQYMAGAEDDWWSRAPMRVGELRALLDAYRERRDDGDGEAWRLLGEALTVIRNSQEAEILRGYHPDASEGRLAVEIEDLLARRAAAPAGGEGAGGDGNEETT